ncbi:MAG: glycosyltransferase [Selenomonadaceae bacterium]|nr:glycosyltransferase [Selenomonadaceae bacterium]
MNVLQINNTDLPGARFNGYNVMEYLNSNGISCSQIVYERLSNNDNVYSIKIDDDVNNIIVNFEKKFSLHSVIIPYAHLIKRLDQYIDADIIHYHLIHNNLLSIYDLPMLMKNKINIFTLHDPWIFTGHCTHPIDCTEWLSGCEKCNNLERLFSISKDNSHNMWLMKKEFFEENKKNLSLIVASKWMLDIVKRSPITSDVKNVYYVPFGININTFSKENKNKKILRKQYGIRSDDFVVMFRETSDELKGMFYIIEMLKSIYDVDDISIVTVGMTGLLEGLKGKYSIKEFGWINDEKVLSDIYGVSDVFIMTSIAESFGVMAIEAMAASLPVVVFKETALEEIVADIDRSLCVEYKSIQAMKDIILKLKEDKQYYELLSIRAYQNAQNKYDEQIYFENICNIYNQLI